MKKKYLSLLAACSFLFAGCSDFLDMNPNGILDEESVSGVEQLDKLVISAYSAEKGIGPAGAFACLFVILFGFLSGAGSGGGVVLEQNTSFYIRRKKVG